MNHASTGLNYAAAPLHPGAGAPVTPEPERLVGEYVCSIVANAWVNDEYKHLVLDVPAPALRAQAGQFFNLLCPSPDELALWARRPMSIYAIDRQAGRLEFVYKCTGRGTLGMARLGPGEEFNIVGPLGRGFELDPGWRNIVVLGRGVGLATLAPLSQMAAEKGVGVTALLSARTESLIVSADLFGDIGADVVTLLDTDGTSSLENVEVTLADVIAADRAEAFFTCGSNRLLQLMKRLGREHDIPGQVALEQTMACGLGPCYICVRTFEVEGELVLRRVCRDGPVFDIQEAVRW
jgi:dihydroorotate dehydrogenase electron transfer subunit